MANISSGIKALDSYIDGFYVGENIVWELESGIPFQYFLRDFIIQATRDEASIIYVSFNHSPNTIISNIQSFANTKSLILIDCFSYGKGKGDATFTKFYKNNIPFQVVMIENPADINSFTAILNDIEDRLPTGARYIFDSLTGMQDLWGNEELTYKFFTYMCPRLFDLETVAYWLVEKDAHTISFRANLRHITQVVLELYTRKDKMFIKAHKSNNRENRDLFKPHQISITSGQIQIQPIGKDKQFLIGDIVKEIRNKLNMSQKELAQRLDVTPSFISQIENNQISPSVHSLMQICKSLDVSPTIFFNENSFSHNKPYIFIKNRPHEGKYESIIYDEIINTERFTVRKVFFAPFATYNEHINSSKRPEYVYVIKGNLLVSFPSCDELITTGDSLYIKDNPISWVNKGGDEAEILLVW
ncbi:MAG: helix-turn-helix domain-containing protein [Thermodesulfovibrionales bacterium]|nr:helix-turn-helix domain-containing protein [Thermodesulfovibrionales bacterium]